MNILEKKWQDNFLKHLSAYNKLNKDNSFLAA